MTRARTSRDRSCTVHALDIVLTPRGGTSNSAQDALFAVAAVAGSGLARLLPEHLPKPVVVDVTVGMLQKCNVISCHFRETRIIGTHLLSVFSFASSKVPSKDCRHPRSSSTSSSSAPRIPVRVVGCHEGVLQLLAAHFFGRGGA